MQISNIPSLLVSPITVATHYFKESSWKGRTIQILLAGALIYLVVVRLKAGARSSNLAQIKRSSNFASYGPPVRRADMKLAPVSYRDKDFVQNLVQRIDSHVLGADIVKSASEWKEDDQAFVWNRRKDFVMVKWLSENKHFFENDAQDPRLPAEMVTHWKKIREEFSELIDPKKPIDEKATCIKFKNWIIDLQNFEQEKKEALKIFLSKELEKIQERQFEKLDRYLQYLSPNPTQDHNFFGIERGDIWTLGLADMDDIGVLHLRNFDHLILTLRQLCCCLSFELQGREISPELQERFLAKIGEFRAEITKVRALDLKPKLGLKTLLDSVDAILAKYASVPFTPELLAILPQKIEELEHWDKVRQMIFLKKYIQQERHAEVWTVLRGQDIHTLSQYYVTYEVLDNPSALYHIVTSLPI